MLLLHGVELFFPSVLQWWFYSRLPINQFQFYHPDHFQQLVLSDFPCLLAKIAKRKCFYFTVSLYLHYCNYNSGSERGEGGSTIVGKNFITVSVVG